MIVGGGYIGLEVAASLRALGLDVTVLEATERVLERVTAPEVSAFFQRIHQEEGVSIRTGALVEAFTGETKVREVLLSNGEAVPADLVIVGIGVEPNTELAASAGLEVDNGIVIDDRARTSDRNIVAAGDCTSRYMAPTAVGSAWNAFQARGSRPKWPQRRSLESPRRSLLFHGSGRISTTSSSRSLGSTPGSTKSSSAVTRNWTVTSPASTFVKAS